MTLVLILAAFLMALLVTLVTCLQVLYLESLRIRARELPALQFFKETLEATQSRILGTVLSERTFPVPERIYRRL